VSYYYVVGSCPKCGAPVYAVPDDASTVVGPPRSVVSCDCSAEPVVRSVFDFVSESRIPPAKFPTPTIRGLVSIARLLSCAEAASLGRISSTEKAARARNEMSRLLRLPEVAEWRRAMEEVGLNGGEGG
jgi:hypothetical protein